jgi:hypothetical protein
MGHSRDSQHIIQDTEGRQTKQKYNIQSLKEEQRESHQIPDDEPRCFRKKCSSCISCAPSRYADSLQSKKCKLRKVQPVCEDDCILFVAITLTNPDLHM